MKKKLIIIVIALCLWTSLAMGFDGDVHEAIWGPNHNGAGVLGRIGRLELVVDSLKKDFIKLEKKIDSLEGLEEENERSLNAIVEEKAIEINHKDIAKANGLYIKEIEKKIEELTKMFKDLKDTSKNEL